ncbi:partner of SLD five, PSF3 [Ancylostoma ceylanicum]|uniref:DNA replication complex GINS protein PSF3 n=1 Tax=Ancylostoma ceylanicum TaxID=53326 RepID=A0A0D6M9C0_9BILA|nr:partner of SLD five, PSF3 [Ancylostoma ceylanicum]
MAANEVEVPSDFYDIDSLLSRSTRVTCTYSSGTPRDVYDMLGTTAPHFTDEKGYKVLTPFWFVRALEPFCSLVLPMAYNSNVRNVLLANAAHADLEALQPYYYEMGMHLCNSLNETVSIALAECLLKTIVQRIGGKPTCRLKLGFAMPNNFAGFIGIVLRTIHGNEAPRRIDNLEKKLYEESAKNRDRLQDYFRKQRSTKGRKRRYE